MEEERWGVVRSVRIIYLFLRPYKPLTVILFSPFPFQKSLTRERKHTSPLAP